MRMKMKIISAVELETMLVDTLLENRAKYNDIIEEIKDDMSNTLIAKVASGAFRYLNNIHISIIVHYDFGDDESAIDLIALNIIHDLEESGYEVGDHSIIYDRISFNVSSKKVKKPWGGAVISTLEHKL